MIVITKYVMLNLYVFAVFINQLIFNDSRKITNLTLSSGVIQSLINQSLPRGNAARVVVAGDHRLWQHHTRLLCSKTVLNERAVRAVRRSLNLVLH